MGWRYTSFRASFEVKRKLGFLKKKFPINPPKSYFISLKEWRLLDIKYFFQSKTQLNFPKQPSEALQVAYQEIINGKLTFFNAIKYKLGKNYDWVTNPSNNYKYDAKKHWLDIPDLSKEAGDIKYVWEKSRFSYIYTVIRYDYHFNKDCAQFVFNEILSWVDNNPVNCGPNWRCSQEISLRILNWIFALYYYKDSTYLTEERFQQIINSIYWQLKHVREHISFSRIAVRNNHAITETLMLYIGGLFFPFFSEAKEWKEKGRKWFEEEVAYQVYEDGTFLQFSHNYHRVLIQLLTVAFYLSKLNGEPFEDLTNKRAKEALNYLFQCTNFGNGMLPNYGANDGALFFKLNDQPYRDYRPQLNALAYYFFEKPLFNNVNLQEDIYWYTSTLKLESVNKTIPKQSTLNRFDNGGYYLMRDDDTFTFIKCGSYKDRPSHADNLHIDLWYKGENILRDAGTFKYNAPQKLLNYFNGTSAHNTITLGNYNQMKKGPRFIWLGWSKSKYAKLKDFSDKTIFEGEINAFRHIDKNIYHIRKVTKYKDAPNWIVEDIIEHSTGLPIKQYWNISEKFYQWFTIDAINENNEPLKPLIKEGFYSSLYGYKETSKVIVFTTSKKKIITKIQLK
jgi:hypothetical protein